MSGGDDLVPALQARFDRGGLRWFDRVLVVDACGSTQDEAKRACTGRAGLVAVARRQTAGRGRLGRAWADTSHLGLPVTFVVDARRFAPEFLSLAAGMAACATCELALNYHAVDLDPLGVSPLVPIEGDVPALADPRLRQNARSAALARPVGLRWPNDVVDVRGGEAWRKVAGVLIEASDGLAYVGIGINVLHARGDWAVELAGRAVSLRELGSEWARGQVAVQLVAAFDAMLALHASTIVQLWRARDALLGRRRSFEHDGVTYVGTVQDIDPASCILLRLDDGSTKRLPALSTSMVHD